MDIDRIRKLRSMYADVEKRLKNIEYNADGNLNIPCINQLRYVGNHLLDYLVNENESDLTDAEGHCARALYDSYEVEALYYLKTFQRFQAEYEDSPISDCVPQYLDWCTVADDASGFVREHSQSEGRGAYYSGFDMHIVELQKIHARLPHAREALNKKLHKSVIDQRWVVGGIVLAVVFGLAGIFFWLNPDLGKEIWSRMFGAHTTETKHVSTAKP